MDPVVGGRFTERWTGTDGKEMVTTGSVLEASDGRLLRLTWSDADWPAQTEVEISVTPAPGGTFVRVRHSGFERLPDGQRLAKGSRRWMADSPVEPALRRRRESYTAHVIAD